MQNPHVNIYAKCVMYKSNVAAHESGAWWRDGVVRLNLNILIGCNKLTNYTTIAPHILEMQKVEYL